MREIWMSIGFLFGAVAMILAIALGEAIWRFIHRKGEK